MLEGMGGFVLVIFGEGNVADLGVTVMVSIMADRKGKEASMAGLHGSAGLRTIATEAKVENAIVWRGQ